MSKRRTLGTRLQIEILYYNAAKFIATYLTRWRFRPAGDTGSFFQQIMLRNETVRLLMKPCFGTEVLQWSR